MSLLKKLLLDPAHLLSLSRILLAAVLWLRAGDARLLLGLVAVAGLTDLLDGWVGRRTHPGVVGADNIGAWLDPVCDKIFGLSAVAVIVVHWSVPLGALALLLLRDVVMLPLAIAFRVVAGPTVFRAHDFRARPSGKVTTVAQFAGIAAAVVMPVAVWPLAILTGLLGVFALAERVVLAVRSRRLSAG